MNKRMIGITAVLLSGSLWSGALLGYYAGYRLNLTNSAPRGLWRMTPHQPKRRLERGDFIELCAPDQPLIRVMEERGHIEAGSCPGTHAIPFLKAVAAVAGDIVVIRHGEDANINGQKLQNTVAMKSVPAWPDGTYRVAPGTVWVLSAYSEGSFDSRYFGPVPLERVHGTVCPVLVVGDVRAMTPWRQA
ncbi:conjugative transfer signal peptidase TraF [Brucella sp. NBRC 12950]|jgi:conjugative transfer signal peptidase TraF|uniref:conjugative transfer signal peptidase TraF n=1 Tax=Brucella sp. NBRC 12950 TaxID=2994518 RepID=UPI0024A43370|nr:conjugative transfer signal peptidase TraF [Brucella sp. NBRC 12950]GLU28259.1 putative conjugal transfer protein TraF [Brucella sp. NBRC 12950]